MTTPSIMNQQLYFPQVHQDDASPTAWMPLEGLAQQWGQFGAETTNLCGFHAVASAFAALERESSALHDYQEVLSDRRASNAFPFFPFARGAVLPALSQAAEHWAQTASAMQDLVTATQDEEEGTPGQANILLDEALHQLQRVSLLHGQVCTEYLVAFAQQREARQTRKRGEER